MQEIIITTIIAIALITITIVESFFSYKKKSLKPSEIFKVEIIRDRGVNLPLLASSGAAGFDLEAHSFLGIYRDSENNIMETVSGENVVLNPGERLFISTGLKMKIPVGYEMQIRSRSGLSLKKGLIVLNAPGTIDSDYRGDIGIILFNASKASEVVYTKDRICQGVFVKVEAPVIKEVLKFDTTSRNDKGFGSTGTSRG